MVSDESAPVEPVEPDEPVEPVAPARAASGGGRRRLIVLVALTLVAAVVAVAGIDRLREDDPRAPYADYCAVVVEQRALVGAALEAGPTTGLIRALPAFRALSAEAPDDIADDWTRVIAAVDGLVAALEDAGLDPATYDRQRPPDDLSREQRDAIDAAATALGSPATASALSAVEQQARDVCGSPLSL